MSGETGNAAKTMLDAGFNLWQGALPHQPSWPHDKGDFGRCMRLLRVIPQMKSKMHLVAKKYPKEWGGIMVHWDLLVKLHEDKSVSYEDFSATLENVRLVYAQNHHAEEQMAELQKHVDKLREYLGMAIRVARKGSLTIGEIKEMDEAEGYLDGLAEDYADYDMTRELDDE